MSFQKFEKLLLAMNELNGSMVTPVWSIQSYQSILEWEKMSMAIPLDKGRTSLSKVVVQLLSTAIQAFTMEGDVVLISNTHRSILHLLEAPNPIVDIPIRKIRC